MTYYVAIFADPGTGGNPMFGEIDIRDASGRRMDTTNSTVVHGYASDWDEATDDDTSTYYYGIDEVSTEVTIVHFDDGAKATTAKFFRGSGSFDTYAPVGIRVYQDTTNHGTSESNWPTETKQVDETYSVSVEWTDEYVIDPSIRTLDITEDTHIREGMSGSNFHTSKSLYIRGGTYDHARALFKLPVPTLGGNEKIVSAWLSLTGTTAKYSGYEFAIYEVNDDWGLTTVTHNNQPPMTEVGVVEVTAPGTNYSYLLDITGYDLTNGIAISGTTTDAWGIHSSDADDAAMRPQVIYEIEPPSNVDIEHPADPMTADADAPDAVVSIEYPFDYSAQPMEANAETVDVFVEAESSVEFVSDVATATAEMGDSSAGIAVIIRPVAMTADSTSPNAEVATLMGITEDTYWVSTEDPKQDHSSDTAMYIGGSGGIYQTRTHFPYMKLPASDAPAGMAVGGVRLYLHTSFSEPIGVWRVNEDWDADTLHIDGAPSLTPVGSLQYLGTAASGHRIYELPEGEYPYGIRLSGPYNYYNTRSIVSSEHSYADRRPQVEYEYVPSTSPVFNASPMEASVEINEAAFALGDEMKPTPMLATVSGVDPDVHVVSHNSVEASAWTAEASEIGGVRGWPVFINADPMDVSTEVVDPSLDLEVGVVYKYGTMSASTWTVEPMVNGYTIEDNPANDPYYQRVVSLGPEYFFRLQTKTNEEDNAVGGSKLYFQNITRKTDGPQNRVYARLGGNSIISLGEINRLRRADESQRTGRVRHGGDSMPGGTLEFSLRTTKKNQFVFYQQATTGTTNLTTLRPNELWMKDGRLAMWRAGQFMNTYTDVADGDWHHIVIRGAGWSYTSLEIFIDGRLERRVYFNSPFRLDGFPQLWGQKPPNAFSAWSAGFEGSDVGENEGFVGDLAELSWFDASIINRHNITRNYYAFMGWQPIEAAPVEATAEGPEASVRGNKPRVLYFRFFDEVPRGRLNGGWSSIFTESYRGENMHEAKWGITGRGMDAYGATFFPIKVFSGAGGTTDSGNAWLHHITGEQRMIDLDRDLDMDDFDAIVFQDWPTSLSQIRYLDNAFPGEVERLTNQIKEQVKNGKRLLVTNHRMAVDLGIIDDVEWVPLEDRRIYDYGSAYKFPWNIDFDNGIDKNSAGGWPRGWDGMPANRDPEYLRYKAQFYGNTNNNIKFRVRALIEGLTDIPSYMIEDAIFHMPGTAWPWTITARKYLERMDGLQRGDEFLFQDWGAPGDYWIGSDGWAGRDKYGRYAGTYGVPPGAVKAGTVVTTYGSKIWKGDQEIENPVKDYATTIAVQEGDTLGGEVIQGRIFVSFTETPLRMFSNLVRDYFHPDAVEFFQNKRPGRPLETPEQREWHFSQTRTTTSKSGGYSYTSNTIVIDGQEYAVRNQNQEQLFMIRSRAVFPQVSEPYVSMTGRGYRWLMEGLAEEEDIGRNNIRVEPMEASAETPAPEVTSEFGANVTATAVNAWAQMPKVAEDVSGDVETFSMPMTASTSFSGYSSEYKAEVMTATGEFRENIEVDQTTEESIVLTLHGFDTTLYLKEEV